MRVRVWSGLVFS